MVLKLVFTAYAGRSLAPKDITGFSDPYLIISFNGQKKRSKIIMQNLNPRWNQKFVFDLPQKLKDGINIVVECWDWDMIGSDDFMGTVSLRVDSEKIIQAESKSESIQTWIPLQGRSKKKEEISGDISYSIEFFPEELCDFKEEVKPVKAAYLQYFSRRNVLGKKSKGKKRFIYLTQEALTMHASDKMNEKPLYQVIDLTHEIKEIKVIKDVKYPSFSIQTTIYKEKEFFFVCEDTQEMMNWVLSLSALQAPSVSNCLLDPLERSTFLKEIYFNGHKGGEISSSYEENWTYTSDGTILRHVENNYSETTYKWNGEVFLHVTGKDYGYGRWDGLNLTWFQSNTEIAILEYMLNDGQYSHLKNGQGMDYKWTRHFLASKSGQGHWSVEGSVPQPVVMFLQCMRFVNTQFSL